MVEVIGFELERLEVRANRVLELRLQDRVILRLRRKLMVVRLLMTDLNLVTRVLIDGGPNLMDSV